MILNSISERLADVAFTLFRSWTLNAQPKYPDISFSIQDESILVSDLKHSIQSALKSLFKRDRKARTSYPHHSWEIGFLLGFIRSNLNGHWFFEYVTKQDLVYKEIMVLSAVSRYLKTNDSAGIIYCKFTVTLFKVVVI
jgi:hypothetical protein